MRAVRIIFSVLLVLFAIFQYNDPDPILWMVIYGMAALLCFLSLKNTDKSMRYLGLLFVGFSIAFSLYNWPSVWMGFDQPTTLGRWAFGGNTALPVWVNYMGAMLAGKKHRPFPQPDGIVNVRIDPETGLLAQPGQANAIFELFKQEQIPARDTSKQGMTEQSDPYNNNDDEDEESAPGLLF